MRFFDFQLEDASFADPQMLETSARGLNNCRNPCQSVHQASCIGWGSDAEFYERLALFSASFPEWFKLIRIRDLQFEELRNGFVAYAINHLHLSQEVPYAFVTELKQHLARCVTDIQTE